MASSAQAIPNIENLSPKGGLEMRTVDARLLLSEADKELVYAEVSQKKRVSDTRVILIILLLARLFFLSYCLSQAYYSGAFSTSASTSTIDSVDKVFKRGLPMELPNRK